MLNYICKIQSEDKNPENKILLETQALSLLQYCFNQDKYAYIKKKCAKSKGAEIEGFDTLRSITESKIMKKLEKKFKPLAIEIAHAETQNTGL